MEIDTVSLLPSKALQARLREETHALSEKDTLLILYHYARTQEERLALLAKFAETASEHFAALARRILVWEEEKLARFRESFPGFLYEVGITDLESDYEERCLCDTYETAVASIDAYFRAYTDIEMRRTDPFTFEIRKLPVTRQGMPWPENTPGFCRVDANGQVLYVDDLSRWDECLPEELCAACENFCLYDDICYPFFVAAGQLVRYTSSHYPHAKVEYGLCPEDFDRSASSHIYVYPLASDAVRLCDVSEEACTLAHEHIDAPLCDIVLPEELPEDLCAPAAAFWEAYQDRFR